MAPQGRNRTTQHRLESLALTDLSRDGIGDAFVGRAGHKRQRFANTIIRKEVQVWRLLQLDRERLLQRVVECRVAGRVDEVGEQDRVAIGQCWSVVAEMQHPDNYSNSHN